MISVNKSIFLSNNITLLDKSIKLSPKLGAERFIQRIFLCPINILLISNDFYQTINDYIQPILKTNFEVNEITFVSGDINQDDTIDILDVIICISIIIEELNPSNYQLLASDMNSDNAINVQDIILLINTILDQ